MGAVKNTVAFNYSRTLTSVIAQITRLRKGRHVPHRYRLPRVSIALCFVACCLPQITFAQTEATPVERLKVAEGFQVERLYSVPKDKEGSWVSMCVDPQGRLIVSDQNGGLFRVTPPAIGKDEAIRIEKINVDIGEAQGLLWAFDALYVVVNKGGKYTSGLYRVTDTDDDDQLDKLETLRILDGGAEHGPHAVLLTPDGKSLVVVCGNLTKLTDIDESRVPENWDEDNLLPRPYGRGFMKGTPAPGGCIYRIDPDGKTWELIASGFRNQYDAAFNDDGELFSYDADMEWDMNTPWYRPTRVCHVVSGAEFGWRNGGGKWPAYYPDSVGAVVNVGPGSPTGICFGYGAKFPAKYQQALFICDWSYGKLYAVHMQPDGASYTGELEEFITGTPLPLTDIVIRPQDGAMYFAVGGRKVQSGLYRVTYQGDQATSAADASQSEGADARALRHKLEGLHNGLHYDGANQAWPHLSSSDRSIRYAARIAVEHRHRDEWRKKALAEDNTEASLQALLALARSYERKNKGSGEGIDSAPPKYDAKDNEGEFAEARAEILASLARHDWAKLSPEQRVTLLRIYEVTFCRTGAPNTKQRKELIAKFAPLLPADSYEINNELAELLVYLQAPSATPKIVELLLTAPTQEQQLAYAKSLRHARNGWTPALREKFFRWFNRAANYRGGAAFTLFVNNMKQDAVAHLSQAEKQSLAKILNAKPPAELTFVEEEPREFVKKWTVDELAGKLESQLKNRDFDHGKKMFAAAKCFACHRFDEQGGAIGPDLTSLAGRFSARDILESVVEPSKQISDQYEAVRIVTEDGKVINGRIVNLARDTYRINTNMLDPAALEIINVNTIDEMTASNVSMMPEGLLDTFEEDEILDLMAYLLSRGDRQSDMFGGK